MTSYLVQTALGLANGTTLTVPVQLFLDKDRAAAFREERQGALKDLLSCQLVRLSGGDQVEDTGLRLGAALSEFGIVGFSHQIVQLDVEDSRLVVASSQPRLVGL